MTIVELRDQLAASFNKEELRSLCFDLSINFELFPDTNIEVLARDLISYCDRTDRLPDLIAHCGKLRPHKTWTVPISSDKAGGKAGLESQQEIQQTSDTFQVNLGDIGPNTQIAVGKSITQMDSPVFNVFQTNQKLVILSLILLFLGVGAVLFILWPKQGEQRMEGTFNIAIAAFDSLSDENNRSSEQGEIIATWLTNELKNQEVSLPPGTQIGIWGPERTGKISGDSREQRAQAAQILAKAIGAHIVIYGYIDEGDGKVTVHPEFYVELPDFEAGQEITGPYQMGSPIEIPGELIANPVLSAGINRELNGRAVALSHFTMGLVHFALNEFQLAYDEFAQAENTPAWEDDQGKEVIYLFLGNAALNLHDWEEAHAWFDKALEANPDYARAYVGKGFAYFQEAIAPMPEQTADADLLKQSIAAFETALTAPDQPQNADVEARVHFGMGRAYLLLGWQEDGKHFVQAEEMLQFVVNEYQAGNIHYQELSAQAYGQLGMLYFMQGKDNEAIQAFEKAIELSKDTQFKETWRNMLNKMDQGQDNG